MQPIFAMLRRRALAAFAGTFAGASVALVSCSTTTSGGGAADATDAASDASTDAASCYQEMTSFAENVLAPIETEGAAGCTSDGDCILAEESLRCFVGCPRAIVRDHQASYDAALAKAESSCPADGCTIEASCARFEGAACRAGACAPVVAGTTSGPDAAVDGGASLDGSGD